MSSTASRPPRADRRRVRPRPRPNHGMRTSFTPVQAVPSSFRRLYLPTNWRFLIAVATAVGWAAFSLWLSRAWLDDLAGYLGRPMATVVLALVALIPGLLVAFTATSVAFDRPPPMRNLHPKIPVTVLLAARNEESTITQTLDYLAAQDYDGELDVVLIDNGSTDGTVVAALKAAGRNGGRLTVLSEPRTGKSFALNRGLAMVRTPIVVTVDADTLLQKSAVRLLVARLQTAPADVAAVAGHLMVRNSRDGWWARLQVWDYLLGIAAVKRAQGMFQGTLVAQGAFSGYRTNAVRQAGGWPAAIGEDIVLTWRLLLHGRVYYEPLALGFTSVPTTLRHLGRQRSRWARGMLEGLRAVPPWAQWRWTVRALAGADLAVPLLDLAYLGAWLPGLVLAGFGQFWLAGPIVVAVLPVNLALYALLYRRQRRAVLEPLGLRPRRDVASFLLFLTFYQSVLSVMSVRGYAQQLLHREPTWR